MVQGLGSTGGFLVLFDGYGTTEEVAKDSVQLGTADDDTGYQGGRWLGRGAGPVLACSFGCRAIPSNHSHSVPLAFPSTPPSTSLLACPPCLPPPSSRRRGGSQEAPPGGGQH